MLPAGLLREPLRGLARAGIFVVTRWAAAVPAGSIEAVVRRYNPNAPILVARHEPEALIPVGVRDADSGGADAPSPLPLATLRGAPVHAFCGIGNPGAFRATLEDAGAVIGRFEAFRDHHVYVPDELERLAARARDEEARLLVTTEKDAIRIARAPSAAPLHALRIRMEVQEEARLLAPVLSLAGRQ
jgi:tetraacyldisaccharide 4'-kinase